MLYDSPVFGPIISRRLGVSLGVNLLPGEAKICSFDCLYCECGYNRASVSHHRNLPERPHVARTLRARLEEMRAAGKTLNVITFAGNGEPTLHPRFPEIVDDTIALRDELFPEAKISVLSNATQIVRRRVFTALQRVDNNILKLDTASADYIQLLDRPVSPRYKVEKVVEKMAEFEGHCIVQTMFLTGTHEGKDVSNLGEQYVGPWLEALQKIQPQSVMVYTIDRLTPSPMLEKASPAELDAIAARVKALGIPCQVSY